MIRAMNTDTEAALRSVIASEERRIKASFDGDSQWALLELARSMDVYFYYVLSLEGDDAKQEANSERHYLNVYGWNKALSLFLDDGCRQHVVRLFPSIPEAQRWADSVVQHCGRLGYCEVGLDMVRYGLASLEKMRAGNFRFTLSTPVAVGAVEGKDFGYLADLVREMDAEAWHAVHVRRDEMIERMTEFVYRWKDQYIGYTTTPEIDDYYERVGTLWVRGGIGQDAFPGDALFGGQPFNLYRATLAALTAWALKHLDLSQALLRKRPGLLLRNILTIFQDRDLIVESLSCYLGVPVEAARQALAALTLTPDNQNQHTATPGGYSIPLIQIGGNSLIKSVGGLLTRPFDFLLAELRRCYPQDCDRAVALRESQFRNDLYHLFPERHLMGIPCPVKLRSAAGSTATDIDAAVFDRRTGSLGLFQLKWQDPFGSSMRKRASRKDNFLESGNRWVQAVAGWLSTRSPREIAQQFRLPASREIGTNSVYLFALGRNFAHFSGDTGMDPRAAWGIWPQVVRLAVEGRNPSDPIRGLFEGLRRDSPFPKAAKLVEELQPFEMVVGGHRVRLEYSSRGDLRTREDNKKSGGSPLSLC